MKKAIIFTGTPCVGKTTLANKVSLLLKKEVINISNYAKKEGLFEDYDEKRDTYEICEKKLVKKLINKIEKIKNKEDFLLIEGHMSHFIPKSHVGLCIVCKCKLKELKERLQKRNYSEKKIKENLECEIFDICLNEAKENKHTIKIIDCTVIDKRVIEEVFHFIKTYIKGHVL